MSNCRLRITFPILGRLLPVVLLALVCYVNPAHAQSAGRSGVAPRRPPNHPSIIVIMADSLGYGDLGCYGQKQIKTPNIDQLAAEGMRFTSFYAGSAEVVPSSASLLLGKHSGHIDIRGDRDLPLQPGDVTLPELLHAAHFATGVFGHWGLGDVGSSGLPDRKGFDEWYGYLDEKSADEYYPEILYRAAPGRGEQINQDTENSAGQRRGMYANAMFTQAALNFIRLLGPERIFPDKAYFLYLPYTIARANRALAAKTGNGMEVPRDAPYTYAGEAWAQPEKNRAAMITLLDNYVGSILDKLKKLKNDNDTIIIFTSGNGPLNEGGVYADFFHSAGPFRGAKGDLHEGGIRVPFIVHWPARIKAGATSDLPAAFWDVMPTVLEMAGQLAPGNIDGISLLPTLLGQSQTNRHEFLYWEIHDQGFTQAVRMGDWKALRSGMDGPLELYNLKTDPGEKTNVAGKNSKVVASIEKYLTTARAEDRNWPAKTAAENPTSNAGR